MRGEQDALPGARAADHPIGADEQDQADVSSAVHHGVGDRFGHQRLGGLDDLATAPGAGRVGSDVRPPAAELPTPADGLLPPPSGGPPPSPGRCGHCPHTDPTDPDIGESMRTAAEESRSAGEAAEAAIGPTASASPRADVRAPAGEYTAAPPLAVLRSRPSGGSARRWTAPAGPAG